MDRFPADRTALIRALFPKGVPQLWSPSLFFYDAGGGFERARQEAHLTFMARHVGGFLIPGSTGDAWEMEDEEAVAALDLAIDFAGPRGIDLLAGVLRPDVASMGALLERMVKHLCDRAGTATVPDAFEACRVRGVTVAPPTTPEPLSQPALAEALGPLLARGLPMAVYQLPQVTGNRMAPELLADLAGRFPNFILFKDSGGTDEVARSGLLPDDLVLLRGAEGDYARWHAGLGGPYDGFLLSTANAFPARLAGILEALKAGRSDEAREESDRLSSVVAEAFAAADGLPDGNGFTNANKLLAHGMAFGKGARSVEPPLLHAGSVLPADRVERVITALEQAGMLPAQGYMTR
ncbi:dihydrodipicolinate synthase family protein [Pararoseomonas indoligenes]|uniref:Dihydrodipicolinate synthase family protein n=1 Tax=Roseomonas indoligenes TaxID=2820811 RepID=A0A940MY33_9PROT|nr:dihydrodipicolinate synthase family protein [Pararoseomonas indoligenes]MBP0496413.1 dihydrodipicolinate synthase family protein [Pararoseomonas indoligenes]